MNLEKLLKKKLFGVGLILGTLFAIEFPDLSNKIYHKFNPSNERKIFKEHFGFPINGWEANLEENKIELSLISQIIEKEKIENDFDINFIKVRSENLLKKSIADKLAFFLKKNSIGQYAPFNRIVINECLDKIHIHHEIKHAKTFNLKRENSDFLKKWKEISKDSLG